MFAQSRWQLDVEIPECARPESLRWHLTTIQRLHPSQRRHVGINGGKVFSQHLHTISLQQEIKQD